MFVDDLLMFARVDMVSIQLHLKAFQITELFRYKNVDYARFLVDRKSTLGVEHFLGSSLIS